MTRRKLTKAAFKRWLIRDKRAYAGKAKLNSCCPMTRFVRHQTGDRWRTLYGFPDVDFREAVINATDCFRHPGTRVKRGTLLRALQRAGVL